MEENKVYEKYEKPTIEEIVLQSGITVCCGSDPSENPSEEGDKDPW